ncbi:MAG TPA: UDP-3-O-(3-hydroxymyristoyl)glucosamine N-acyltransferase [Chthoniobacteraceae bacterium]|nr:UDP-3-O-(3-hydroxymyristoyl)glucosamine N-acyltransferase [Chthoniobacteraceae bacterium]
MSRSVDELAALVEGQVAGNAGSAAIHGVAAVQDAVEGQITFLANQKYLPALKATRATAVLVPPDFTGETSAIQIRVADPMVALAKVLEVFAPPAVVFAPGVHATAVVAPDAVLGKNVSVQAYAVVESGAKIGDISVVGAHVYIGHGAVLGADCRIYPNVTIREHSIIGSRVIIHSGAVIGGDGFGYEFSGGKHVKIPQTGIVQIDDDVEIGSNTTIDRARFGKTWIQEGTKIDNLVQIAHNVVIGKHSVIVSQAGISGSTRLGQYVTLAGQVGLVGHLEIGDQVIVGAQSGVSKNIPAKEIWLGSPATPMQEQKEKFANINRLSKLFARVKKLEQDSDSKSKSLPGES